MEMTDANPKVSDVWISFGAHMIDLIRASWPLGIDSTRCEYWTSLSLEDCATVFSLSVLHAACMHECDLATWRF